ncbi:MAG TPA: helix-turn-helix transcriptional regulator, partial [Terriglobia bacterium]|nr:helix-turn-helix transcriptional regulator [Terriglobia bacterium]
MVEHADRPTIAPAARAAFHVELASGLLPLHRRNAVTAMDARVLRVLKTIARDLGKPQTVKGLAAQLRLSPSRLEHLFRKQTGRGIKAFVRESRLAKAAELLEDPTLQIKEVAAAVGYANVSNFIRDYTRRYGESPSQSRSSPLHDSLISFSSRRGLRGG